MIRLERDQPIDAAKALARYAKYDANAEIYRSCLDRSVEVWAGYHDDDLACVCGLIPPTILSDRAYLWMMHTDVVEDHKFLFVRHSQMWMQKLLERYSVIFGLVESKNKGARRWLAWLGAEFGDREGELINFTIEVKPNG